MLQNVLIPNEHKIEETGKVSKEVIDKMKEMGVVQHFIREAYKHGKPIAAIGEGADLVELGQLPELLVFDVPTTDKGVVTSKDSSRFKEVINLFIKALLQYRFWEREKHKDKIPA